MHQYLGLQIIRDRPNRTISIHQEGFVSAMCERFWNYMTQDEGFSPPTPMLSDDDIDSLLEGLFTPAMTLSDEDIEKLLE